MAVVLLSSSRTPGMTVECVSGSDLYTHGCYGSPRGLMGTRIARIAAQVVMLCVLRHLRVTRGAHGA